MKVYIAISYSKRRIAAPVLRAITSSLASADIESYVFVDNFTFDGNQEKTMMQQAMSAIDECDWLIAETSDKAIGIGVEAGYAKGKNKPVIYLRQQTVAHSTTVCGISDYHVIYRNIDDLQLQLWAVIKELLG